MSVLGGSGLGVVAGGERNHLSGGSLKGVGGERQH